MFFEGNLFILYHCRKIWEAAVDNLLLLNGKPVKKKGASVSEAVCVLNFHFVSLLGVGG